MNRRKLSASAAMKRVIEKREKGLRAIDSPLKRRANARAKVKKRNIPDISLYRPAKPALHAGRVQRACLRCFVAFDGPISTRDAVEWAAPVHCHSVKRALSSIGAVKLRRLGGSGRPLLWAPPSI